MLSPSCRPDSRYSWSSSRFPYVLRGRSAPPHTWSSLEGEREMKRYKVSELVTPHWRKELNSMAKMKYKHHWVSGHFRDNKLITKQCIRCGIIVPAGAKTE